MSKESKRSSDSEIPIIILLGQTGAGKSQFINRAGPTLEVKPFVGHDLTSCTRQVEVFEVESPSRALVTVRLVDTPGFNDTGSTNDDKHLKMIIEWLKKEPNTQVAGILYLHEIHSPRLEESPAIVKPHDIPHPPGVLVVTTKWSLLLGSKEKELGKTRETELRRRFHVEPKFMRRFDNTTESAWEIIDAILLSPSNVKRKTLAKAMKKICVDRPNVWQDAIEMMSNFFGRLFQ